MEKVWHIDYPEEESFPRKRARGESKPSTSEQIKTAQRSPAVAFSLSILVWGGGQFYNRDWKLGGLLALLMVNFWGFLGVAIYLWLYYPYVFGPYLSSANFLFAVWVSFVFASLIWFSGALEAYRRAEEGRAAPFTGVEKRLIPPLCSFIIPGWGQCLNGQFKKGALFLTVSVLLFSSIPSIIVLFLVWPTLYPSPVKAILEWDFAISITIMPLLALIWLVGVYDAFRVSHDELKKESWLKRIKYATNRVRLQGWNNTVLRRAKLTVPLLLILAISVYAGFCYFPYSYYETSARQISVKLSGRDMVVVPQMINRLLDDNPFELSPLI